jgi:hypothetical protein
MKKLIILLFVFVFVTLMTSSCVATLRRDGTYRGYHDNYRNNAYYHNYDNQGNYRKNGKLYRNRHLRNNRSYLKITDGQNSLIIH